MGIIVSIVLPMAYYKDKRLFDVWNVAIYTWQTEEMSNAEGWRTNECKSKLKWEAIDFDGNLIAD